MSESIPTPEDSARTILERLRDGGLWEPAGLDRIGDFLVVADTNHHLVVVMHRESASCGS